MDLNEIYQPIKKELGNVEEILETSLKETRNKSLLKVNHFLLETPGKRLRPALVILSAKAISSKEQRAKSKELIKVASSIELIHIASLIHDDIIDHSVLRHHRPTVNSKWGQETSIALGDYLYSLAFALISSCNNLDILDCISSATKAMCEGELIQVLERDNLSLSRQRYILIVKKKTASLFAASCQAGAIASCPSLNFVSALKGYGLNFGIAFQIIDDCLDLIGKKDKLGKTPGQDIAMGEATLPILNLLESVDRYQRRNLILLLRSKDKNCLEQVRKRFLDSDALLRTKESTSSYINTAKERLKILPDSSYREGLLSLADFILQPFKKFVEEVK